MSNANSSNTASSNSNWTRILGYTALIFGAGVSYILYTQYKSFQNSLTNNNNNNTIAPNTNKVRKSKSKRSKDSTFPPNESELQQSLHLALIKITNREEVIDSNTLNTIRNWIINEIYNNVDEYSNTTKQLCAQFLLTLYSESEYSQDPNQLYLIHQDLEKAWTIIENVNTNVNNYDNLSSTDREINLLRMDISQRLHSGSKMLLTLNNIVNNTINMNDDEIIRCFMAAPILGQFNLFIKLGKIVQLKHDFNEFQHVAILQEEIPDYSALFDLISTNNNTNNPIVDAPASDITWINYEIIGIKKVFKSCISNNPERESEINDIKNNNKSTDFVVPENNTFIRQGCIFRMQSTSMERMPICGVINNNSWFGRGSYLLANEKQQKFKFQEDYALKLVEDKTDSAATNVNNNNSIDNKDEIYLYRGSFTSKLDSISDEMKLSGPELEMHYDIEFKLKKSQNQPINNISNNNNNNNINIVNS